MYDIIFYEDRKGNEPIKDYIKELEQKASFNKDAKINFNKIVAYINQLKKHGSRLGEPFIKHIDNGIWELRPLDNRILYAYYKDNCYILLHHFIKTTKKLPLSELEQAKRNLANYKERNDK